MKTFFAKTALCLIALLMLCPAGLSAQKSGKDADISKYLAGAVPVENGVVVFRKSYKAEGKTKEQVYALLKDYTWNKVVCGENKLPQARITEADSTTGVIAASMEEYLYFKKKAWVTHYARLYYQLVFTVRDGGFDAMMRNIHYCYDAESMPNGQPSSFRAENWITDKEALSKDGTKLTRIGGKFRRFTIDRKDELFTGAARAAGALKKVVKMVEAEEE